LPFLGDKKGRIYLKPKNLDKFLPSKKKS